MAAEPGGPRETEGSEPGHAYGTSPRQLPTRPTSLDEEVTEAIAQRELSLRPPRSLQETAFSSTWSQPGEHPGHVEGHGRPELAVEGDDFGRGWPRGLSRISSASHQGADARSATRASRACFIALLAAVKADVGPDRGGQVGDEAVRVHTDCRCYG